MNAVVQLFSIELLMIFHAWVKWCYCQPAEFCFSSRRILASSGRGATRRYFRTFDFSLVLLEFIDFAKLHDIVQLHLWYLEMMEHS